MTLQEFYTGPERWAQGAMVDPTGARCLAGAIIHCYPNLGEQTAVYGRLKAACGGSIIGYNDSARDFRDILKVIKIANV